MHYTLYVLTDGRSDLPEYNRNNILECNNSPEIKKKKKN